MRGANTPVGDMNDWTSVSGSDGSPLILIRVSVLVRCTSTVAGHGREQFARLLLELPILGRPVRVRRRIEHAL